MAKRIELVILAEDGVSGVAVIPHEKDNLLR